MEEARFVLRDIIGMNGKEVDLLSNLPARRELVDLDLVAVRFLAWGRVDAVEPLLAALFYLVRRLDPADMSYAFSQRSTPIAARPASRKKLPIDILCLATYSSNIFLSAVVMWMSREAESLSSGATGGFPGPRFFSDSIGSNDCSLPSLLCSQFMRFQADLTLGNMPMNGMYLVPIALGAPALQGCRFI